MRKTEDEMPPTIGDRQDGGRAGGRLYAMSGLPQEAGGSRLDEGQKSSARGRDSQQKEVVDGRAREDKMPGAMGETAGVHQCEDQP